jgi:hypothetical protein
LKTWPKQLLGSLPLVIALLSEGITSSALINISKKTQWLGYKNSTQSGNPQLRERLSDTVDLLVETARFVKKIKALSIL